MTTTTKSIVLLLIISSRYLITDITAIEMTRNNIRSASSNRKTLTRYQNEDNLLNNIDQIYGHKEFRRNVFFGIVEALFGIKINDDLLKCLKYFNKLY